MPIKPSQQTLLRQSNSANSASPPAGRKQSKSVTESPSMGDDDASDSDEEDQVDLTRRLTSGAQISQIPLTVKYGRRSVTMRLTPYLAVERAIDFILLEFAVDISKVPAADVKLYKVLRQVKGTEWRQQLDPHQSLLQQHVRANDVLRIRNIRESVRVQVKPETGMPFSFAFDYQLTVGIAIAVIVKDRKMKESVRYGLYHPIKSIWLDDSRTLESYDLDEKDLLELRQLSRDVVIKATVRLPTSASASASDQLPVVAVKVQLTQTVGEVVDMIAREINADPDHIYGLYLTARESWLSDAKCLKDLELDSEFVSGRQTKLEFRMRFRQYKIRTGRGQPVLVHVDVLSTVSDVITSLGMSERSLEELTYSLTFAWNEPIPLSMRMDMLLPNIDTFFYKRAPGVVYLTPSYDPGARVSIDLDFAVPLRAHIPSICRRFGIRDIDFGGITRADDGPTKPLDVSRSLSQLGVDSSHLLVVHSKGPGWERRETYPEGTGDMALVNMWDEPRDIEGVNVTYEQPAEFPSGDVPLTIATASLNKLVERVTDDKSHDLNFLKMFLLTYRSFTTAEQLFAKICERYAVPRPRDTAYEDFERNIRRPIQLRVSNFLKQWMEKQSSDFLDGPGKLSALGHQVDDFVRDVLSEDDPKVAKPLVGTLNKLLDGRLRGTETATAAGEPPLPKGNIKKGLPLFKHHPEEIARQLTLIEFDLFAAIKPNEFLNQGWSRKDASTHSPNILAVSQRFNRTVQWVAASILDKKTVKSRARRMTKIIEIASCLYEMKNFSTLMAVIAGLNSAAITRLKYTRAEVNSRWIKGWPHQRLDELEAIMSAEGSYKAYRAELLKSAPPIVPYIGVFLADLTFIDDGNPDFVHGLINFSKRRLDYQVIASIQLYQAKPFNFREVPQIREYLIDFPESSDAAEKENYERSLELEPRGAERSQIA